MTVTARKNNGLFKLARDHTVLEVVDSDSCFTFTCRGKDMGYLGGFMELIEAMSNYYDRVFLGIDHLGYDLYWDIWLSDIWAD